MFSLIIPLFNEEKNISHLIDEVSYHLNKFKDYELILIDDFSSDNTLKVINNFKYKNLKIIKNSSNLGQSYSIHKGINDSMYDIIITLDGDGQNDPKDISKLLDLYLSNKNIFLVGGIRIKRMDSFVKKISSRVANKIRSIILDDGCKDTGCSLKVFNKDIFLSFPFFDGIHRFLPALYKGYGYKTQFINVNHRKRKYGVSKYGTFFRLFRGVLDMYRVIKILRNKT